jgi:hypothetical protein
MNKILIVILIFGAAGLAYYFISGNKENVSFDAEIIEEVDIDQVEEGLKETGQRTVYGSCNAITDSSSCIDYVGSIWNDNDMGKLNCSDVGIFSKNACPYSEFGGCQTSGGSIMEMIIWAYEEGLGGYDEESVSYARMSCNSLPNARWVTPEELLK